MRSAVCSVMVGTIAFSMRIKKVQPSVQSRDNRDLLDRAADRIEELEAGYESLKSENIDTIKAIAESHRAYAREIFEEIESISSDFPIYGNVNTVILSERDLNFIKKKYTEGEK